MAYLTQFAIESAPGGVAFRDVEFVASPHGGEYAFEMSERHGLSRLVLWVATKPLDERFADFNIRLQNAARKHRCRPRRQR